MRLFAFLLAGILGAASVSSADEAKPSADAMKEKLHAVIRHQLEAFRRDDYPAAYVFAAPGIKSQFPAEAFEKMVRASYPLIAKSTAAVFGLTIDDGKTAVVTVRVVGQAKKAASYQYLLERVREEWRIAGVYELDEATSAI